MKKAFLLFTFILLSIGVKGQDIVDIITYDIRQESPLIYNKTFENSGFERVEFNLPFADHFDISGMHVEFTVSKENVLKYFYNNPSTEYFDLQINFYDGTYIGWHDNPGYICQIKVIRIYFIY